MTRAVLQGWSAWAPGREDEAAWRSWAEAPEALAREGRPEAGFLPSELETLAADAGLQRAQVSRHLPWFRVSLVADHEAAHEQG